MTIPLPLPDAGTVVTVGSFDGVHLGHMAVLREIATRAKAANRASVLVTFEPHPMEVVNPATEEIIASVASASAPDVDAAVAAARAALDGPWGKMSARERMDARDNAIFCHCPPDSSRPSLKHFARGVR